MLDTVTFDLWNTLLSNRPQDFQKYRLQRVENLKEVLQRKGINAGRERLLEAYLKGYEKCHETWSQNKDISTEEQVKNMLGFLNMDETAGNLSDLIPDLVEAYVSPILDDPPDSIEGAEELLSLLEKRGYKIGLVCNTGTTPGKTLRSLLQRMGMDNYFDVTTFSNEMGIRKPDPRIFLHTLAQLKSQPQSSVHVGDLIDADVGGARNVGMVTVHYNPDFTPCDDFGPDFTIRKLNELNWILGDLK
jgi:putative hydrolase of the HAD superfamily